MHEVSCRTTSLLLSGLRFKGVNPRELFSDLPVSYEVLRDPGERIDWDLYAELLFRARQALGSNEALETLAMHHRDAPALAHLRKVAKTLLSARAIYSKGSMRIGNALFMAPTYELEHLDDGRIREVLSIPEPYRNSEEFFYMMRGIIRAGPRQLGLPDSRVEMNLVGRRAEYLITPPPSESLWARGQRWLQRTRAASGAWEELGEQQGQLAENYRSLKRAHERIQEQRRRLERQNRWARELTEHLELDALTRRTVSLLRSKGPYRGVALTLRSPDGELRELHRDTNPKELIGRREELHLGERSVGYIEVWGQETQAEVGFLEDALPWIALALDNARAYDEIHAKKLALEAEVRERMRAEERNRELNEKLLQAQKLESLGVLASGMANDFDDLLVGILGSTRRALETGSEPNSEVLSGILKAGEQAGDLVSTLLAFAGEQQRAPHTLDLSHLVAETLPLVQTAVAKRANFELAAGRETPWIRADLAQVRQVLMNLITNGAESLSGSGGMVRVETGVGELSGSRLAKCVVGDPMAVGRSAFLVVEDDGCGIPKANLNRIFDPFYTTKFAGRGLGLAAVLGIVRSHGGALEVETQENRGSRFSVWFPLAEAPEQDGVAPGRR